MADTFVMSATLLPVVAAALIDDEGCVLLQRRPDGKELAGLWEFPGGKIEPGERPEAALVRELDEELGIAVDPADLIPIAFASADLGRRHLLLLLYTVAAWRGEPEALEASEVRWVAPDAMAALAMPPADRPLVEALVRRQRA
jgi:8-oxo-dGTP diphosphatase